MNPLFEITSLHKSQLVSPPFPPFPCHRVVLLPEKNFLKVFSTFPDGSGGRWFNHEANLHWGVARSSRARFSVSFIAGVAVPSRARAQNYPTQQNKQRFAPGNSWHVFCVDWPLAARPKTGPLVARAISTARDWQARGVAIWAGWAAAFLTLKLRT